MIVPVKPHRVKGGTNDVSKHRGARNLAKVVVGGIEVWAANSGKASSKNNLWSKT